MKVNGAQVKRPKKPEKVFSFTDPDNPDMPPVILRLRKFGSMEMLSALDDATDKTQMYVNGWGEEGEPGYTAPLPLPPVDGQSVTLSESTCRIAASLVLAQTGPMEDRYTFEELVPFMTIDAICTEMAAAFLFIQPGGVSQDPLATTGLDSLPTAPDGTQQAIPV